MKLPYDPVKDFSYIGIATDGPYVLVANPKLNAELKKALADPAVAERLAGAGLVPVGGTPEEMAASIKHDLPRFADLVKKIGIKPE